MTLESGAASGTGTLAGYLELSRRQEKVLAAQREAQAERDAVSVEVEAGALSLSSTTELAVPAVDGRCDRGWRRLKKLCYRLCRNDSDCPEGSVCLCDLPKCSASMPWETHPEGKVFRHTCMEDLVHSLEQLKDADTAPQQSSTRRRK